MRESMLLAQWWGKCLACHNLTAKGDACLE